MDVNTSDTWRLTWVRQDGVCLRQELVTADSLVSFAAPDGQKEELVISYWVGLLVPVDKHLVNCSKV